MSARSEDQSLYYRAMEKTKHFTNYNSEFFRVTGNFELSARSFYEYMGAASEKGIANGSIVGYMSSYGMTNGVPSTATFMHKWAQRTAPNGLVNGYDAYADSAYIKDHGKSMQWPSATNDDYYSARW
jgi:hypothetical protein